MDQFVQSLSSERTQEPRCGPSLGRVLIIEDDVLIALELEAILAEFGYDDCAFADSAEDAVAEARANPPDLITADYRIIGGTGLDAVRAVEAEFGPLPVIYVTANADAVRRESTAPIVEKPISTRDLRRAWMEALTTAGPR